MDTRARKSKGKRLQKYVRDFLRNIFTNYLEDGDIETTIASQSGVDIILSPLAKKFIPFDIECKNIEQLNIWKAIEQSELNTVNGRIPALVFHKNRSKNYICIEFEVLMNLIYNTNNNETSEK